MKPGWIHPPDGAPGDYWVTRRAADAVGEYKLDLPDIRKRFRWNGQAWVTGHYSDGKPVLCCMHTNNGWRFEGPAKMSETMRRLEALAELLARECPLRELLEAIQKTSAEPAGEHLDATGFWAWKPESANTANSPLTESGV